MSQGWRVVISCQHVFPGQRLKHISIHDMRCICLHYMVPSRTICISCTPGTCGSQVGGHARDHLNHDRSRAQSVMDLLRRKHMNVERSFRRGHGSPRKINVPSGLEGHRQIKSFHFFHAHIKSLHLNAYWYLPGWVSIPQNPALCGCLHVVKDSLGYQADALAR